MQKAFIETQFPIARLSAGSFNERDAKNGQTLPRLGRWWGRKPLILVRACIIGMLMPASDDKKKDREIFLKILTMDDDGMDAPKRRIQRIGQAHNQVWIANLRYRDSVEDKVHRVLAERLQAIHELFGQIPDTLEDVWVKVALNDEAEIAELIDQTTATRNPFDKKYSKVEDAAWETCASVLNPISVRELIEAGWA
ncbi:MAG: DUF1156 domain-containing protein [Synechococcaceae cyanobacterium]|jgi:hypothetical protein